MTDATIIARQRIAELKQQIAELERFIEISDALLAGQGIPSSALNSVNRDDTSKIPPGNETPCKTADFDLRAVKPPPNRPAEARRPDEVAQQMERIIREVGRPMKRGELVAAFEARDISIPYEDKARYLGTIAWRHKGKFINLKEMGYWIRELPVPTPSIGTNLLDNMLDSSPEYDEDYDETSEDNLDYIK